MLDKVNGFLARQADVKAVLDLQLGLADDVLQRRNAELFVVDQHYSVLAEVLYLEEDLAEVKMMTALFLSQVINHLHGAHSCHHLLKLIFVLDTLVVFGVIKLNLVDFESKVEGCALAFL